MRFSYVALASSVSLVLLTIILTPVPYKNSCYLHDSPISTSNGVYIAGSLSPPIQSYFHVPLLIHDSPTLPSLYNLLSVAPRPSRSGGSLTYSKTLDSWQLKLGTSQVVAASGKYLDPNDPPSWLPKITLSCDSQLTNEAYPYISPYSLGQRNKQTGTSNLSEITSHPTTFSILLINVLVFVYAYNPANNVSPSSMTTSYAAVITDRETYRMMYVQEERRERTCENGRRKSEANMSNLPASALFPNLQRSRTHLLELAFFPPINLRSR